MTRSSKVRSIEEAHAEVERELQVRTRIYDSWVRDGKMTSVDAQDRYDRLATALEYLNAVLNKFGKNHIMESGKDLPF